MKASEKLLRIRGKRVDYRAHAHLDGCTYDEMPCRQRGRVVSQRMRLAMIDEVKKWEKELQPV